MKTKIVLIIVVLLNISCTNNKNDSILSDLINNYILEISKKNNVDGNYIILSDNGCQGCKKLVSAYFSKGENAEDHTLIT